MVVKLIIAKIIGGLGNQMFQYAMARALSHQNAVELKLDISAYRSYGLAPYELDVFQIQPSYVSTSETVQDFVSYDIIKEPSFPFHQHIYDYKEGKAIVEGYWQSEKYFKNIKDVLRQEFTFKNVPSSLNRDYIKKIQSVNSVSIHFRRGYGASKTFLDYFGLCPLDYYTKAIDYIRERVPEPVFFIFSDDPTWVIQNFKLDGRAYYISHNKGKHNYEDMRLMSFCKHNIIANSSFSWWGAWLNPNPDKIVISPQQWFLDPFTITGDIHAEGWIQM